MLSKLWPPRASLTAAGSEASTWKQSAMQLLAISMLSASSAWRVPSFREVERKSMMERARRLRESVAWVRAS